jgi:hypothetical protein
VKRLLHEPLIHFLLIGAALFALYRYLPPAGAAAAPSTQIQIAPADLSQLAALFQAQWKRDPTPEELGGMIEEKVRAEVLYREAVALGLDKDDEIVKRRLAQKMQFLSEEIAASREPSAGELRTWFTNNVERFAATPGRAPRFEEVETQVRIGWQADQKTSARDKAYREMRAKYTVLLPEAGLTNSVTPPMPGARDSKTAP